MQIAARPRPPAGRGRIGRTSPHAPNPRRRFPPDASSGRILENSAGAPPQSISPDPIPAAPAKPSKHNATPPPATPGPAACPRRRRAKSPPPPKPSQSPPPRAFPPKPAARHPAPREFAESAPHFIPPISSSFAAPPRPAVAESPPTHAASDSPPRPPSKPATPRRL